MASGTTTARSEVRVVKGGGCGAMLTGRRRVEMTKGLLTGVDWIVGHALMDGGTCR